MNIQLRWLRKVVTRHPTTDEPLYVREVLQQRWVFHVSSALPPTCTEWKDVPTEEEK
jgi:hypothetical protein